MKKNDLLTSHLLSSFNFIINRENKNWIKRRKEKPSKNERQRDRRLIQLEEQI